MTTISALQIDLNERFGANINGGDFGIVSIEFPLKNEKLSVALEHYKNTDVQYKISFESFQSYQVTQENLPDKVKEETVYSEGVQSVILKEVIQSKYLAYLSEWTDLKIYFEGDRFDEIHQYTILSQNVIVDVVTSDYPIIEVVSGDANAHFNTLGT